MSTFLNCERLVSPVCTIGDYVIEWRLDARDGTIVFVSGEGSDPAIQAQHPIVNEVVFAGTLYPIIRYAYINGVKYTAYPEDGAIHSPDFIECLDPVVVESITCSTVLGADTLYPYYLTYNNVTDYGADKSRVIKFDLSADTAYFAWDFRGYDVAEQVKIYYCTLLDSTGTLLENFIHGSRYVTQNLYPADYPNNPKIANSFTAGSSPSLAIITSLSDFTYAAGDYIRIEITGSVYEPSTTNTNWWLKCKCLTSGDLDCGVFIADSGMNKITSVPTITYLSDPTCVYKVSYTTEDSPFSGLPLRTSILATTLYKYLSGFYYWYGPGSGNPFPYVYTSPVEIGARWSISTSHSVMYRPTGYTTCVNLAVGETITVTKTTSEVVYTFTDDDDYNQMVSDISDFEASTNYILWEGYTDTNAKYYAYMTVETDVSNSCGDTTTKYYFYYWVGCPISYDAINKTITITFSIPTNNIIDTDCDNTHETVDNIITSLLTTKNYSIPGGSLIAHTKYAKMVISTWVSTYTYHENPKEVGLGLLIEDSYLNGLCDLSVFGFCKGISLSQPNAWILLKYWDRISFTDASTHETRLASWKLERKIGLRTDDCNDFGSTDWETVYQESTTTTTTTETPTTTTTTTSS